MIRNQMLAKRIVLDLHSSSGAAIDWQKPAYRNLIDAANRLQEMTRDYVRMECREEKRKQVL